jgi:hypothetical protein
MEKIPDAAVGFSSGVRYWLFFMICFAVLGYGAGLSIVLGAIGGLAGGTIAAWLNQKDADDVPAKPAEKLLQEPTNPLEGDQPRSRFQKYGYGLTGLQPRQRQRPRKAVRRFGWLFRRR